MVIGINCAILFIFISLPIYCSSLELNLTSNQFILLPLVNTSLWLTSSSYCPSFSYLNRSYIGAAEGFVPTASFYDPQTDSNGYIGHLKSQKSIFVVFRGSKSYNNWIIDLDALLTIYHGCTLCFIHQGFLDAASAVWKQIETELTTLKQQFTDYDIVIVGHSLGGAIATVTALEAVHHGFHRVKLVTFGSPRVGNEQFAEFANTNLHESIRVTHYRDPVPHVPYRELYTHISTEWYENEKNSIRACNGGEDPNCANQWFFTNVNDHVVYLNMMIGCNSVSTVEDLEYLAKFDIPASNLQAHVPNEAKVLA